MENYNYQRKNGVIKEDPPFKTIPKEYHQLS